MSDSNKLDDRLLKEIKKAKLSQQEVKKVISNLRDINPKVYKTMPVHFSKDRCKFLAFTDAHQGHRHYRRDVWRYMIEDAKKQGCAFAINAGDTVEGMSGRDGHIYELDYLGATQQLEFFEKEWALFDGLPVYSIEAQSSHGGWFHNKGNIGLDIGQELERRCEDYKFIGYDEQDLKLDNGLVIRLRHPGGGTAYAVCFDSVTEILTENGWKLFKDLEKTERVATLNVKNDEFEWQLPTDYTEQEYEGEMLHFNSRTVDLLVTPNHRMLVRRYPQNLLNGRKEKLVMPQKSHQRINFDWQFKQAKDLENTKRQEWQMKRVSSNWKGELIEKVEIPERQIKKFGTRQSPRISEINIEDIAELIAWYVTEGHIKKCLISIAQYLKINPENYYNILDLLKRIGLTPKEEWRKQHINVYSLELAEWLIKECGVGSKNKHLPKWLKNQPQDILRIVFDTMIKGDGWTNTKQISYRSISKQLLDDFTEIALKLGYAVTTYKESVSVSKIQTFPTINQKPTKTKYKGKIYCVSVPNTTIMVRRNGKAIWSGNSYKMQKFVESIGDGNKPDIIFQGHFHKANYMFYRGMHCFDGGCLQNQSPFMKKKGTPAHVGYWIIEVAMKPKKEGIERIRGEFVPCYE